MLVESGNKEENLKDTLSISPTEFFESASFINRDHLDVCDCCDIEIQKLAELDESNINSKFKNDIINHPKAIGNELEFAGVKAKNQFATIATRNKLKCRYELAYIKSVLALFSNKYDLKDPKVYVIVGSIVRHMLSTYRYDKFSQLKGAMMSYVDKYGVMQYKVNPSEWAKLKYDTEVVNMIEKLNNITEGIKLNVREYVTLSDILPKSNIIEGEFKEI